MNYLSPLLQSSYQHKLLEYQLKVLVTGATGHLGNNLVRELIHQNYEVRVLCRLGSDITPIKNLDVEIVNGDITDLTSLETACKGIETVFHMASYISLMPFEKKKLYSINVDGMENVIQACKKQGNIELIYMSSIHAIPNSKNKYIGSYAESKGIATKNLLNEIDSENIRGSVLYPTGLIGPNDFKISNIGKTIIAHSKKGTAAYVNGSYDFIDVRDVSKATIELQKSDLNIKEVILSGNNQVSVKELLMELEKLTGISAPKIEAPIKFVEYYAHINGLINKLVGRQAVITGYAIKTLHSPIPNPASINDKNFIFCTRNWKHSIKDQYEWLKSNSYI